MSDISSLIDLLKRNQKIFRITIAGEGAVGKTTLIKSIVNLSKGLEIDAQPDDYKTIRTPFMHIDSWSFEGLTVQSYDLAGQRIPGAHPVDVIPDQVLKSIDLYIFVFALDRFESFENLHEWLELTNATEIDKTKTVLFLVGNKSDLDRSVPTDMIEPLVGDGKVFKEYFETSAIQGDGVKDLLASITSIGLELLKAN